MKISELFTYLKDHSVQFSEYLISLEEQFVQRKSLSNLQKQILEDRVAVHRKLAKILTEDPNNDFYQSLMEQFKVNAGLSKRQVELIVNYEL